MYLRTAFHKAAAQMASQKPTTARDEHFFLGAKGCNHLGVTAYPGLVGAHQGLAVDKSIGRLRPFHRRTTR
jgi:hypothetical protein